MKRIVKFWRLAPAERRLLLAALGWLVAVRVGLWVLPLQRLLNRLQTSEVLETSEVSPTRIAWAIRVAGRYLPGTRNCLVQSLAAQFMLARRGYPARLRIGVTRDEGGEFKAHAWVECGGRILVGQSNVTHFTPFPNLELQRQ